MRGIKRQVGRIGQPSGSTHQFGVQSLGELVGLLSALPVTTVLLPQLFDVGPGERLGLFTAGIVYIAYGAWGFIFIGKFAGDGISI